MNLPKIEKFRVCINSSPEFIKKYSKRVKKAGGSHERVMPGESFRFVCLPNTDEGQALAAELFDRFPERDGGTNTSTFSLEIAPFEGEWLGFKGHYLNLIHYSIIEGVPALGQINIAIWRWESRARLWYAESAIRTTDSASYKEVAKDRLENWPAEIAAELRRALAAGVPVEALKTAFQEVLS